MRSSLAIPVLLLAASLLPACDSPEERAERARAEAREALEHGDRGGALGALRELRGLRPESPERALEQSELMLAAGEAPQALWMLEEAQGRFPESDALRTGLARVALVVQDPARARRVLGSVGPESPQHFEALVLRAQAALDLGELERGLDLLAEAGERYPDRPEARLTEIATLLRERRFEDARARIDALRRSEGLEPALVRRLQLLTALLDARRGDAERAIAAVDAALAEAPADPAAWQALATILAPASRGRKLLERLEEAAKRAPDAALLHRLRAEAYAQLDRSEDAHRALERFVEISGSPSAYRALAEWSADARGAEEAVAVYERGLERHPDSALLRLHRAEALLRANRPEAARRATESFAEAAPEDPHAEYLRARLQLARGEPRAAADRLLALLPELDRAHTQYWTGRALEAAGDGAGAERRYGLALVRDRTNPAPAAALLRRARARGSTAATLDAARKLVERAPERMDAWQALVEGLLESGRPEEASAVARRAAAAFPDKPVAPALRAHAARARGRPAEAERIAREASERLGDHPELAAERALAALAQGRSTEAVATLERAAEAHAGSAAPLRALALARFARGEAEAGARAVEGALEREPQDPGPLALRARYFASRGAFARARRDAARYLEARPQDAGMHFLRGAASEGLGEPEAAEAAYRRAVELDDEAWRPRNNLAVLLERRGARAEALRLAQEAYRIAGDEEPSVVETLGWLYLQDERVARAVALLERAHASAPENADAKLHLALAYRASGRGEEARDLLEGLLARADLPEPIRKEAHGALRRLQD